MSSTAPPHGGPLRLRRVMIGTYRENVAYLHRDCPLYRIHAERNAGFGFARNAAADSGYRIGPATDLPKVFAEF